MLTPEAIAAKHFTRIMYLEDESQGCELAPGLAVHFCCQWNSRPLCGECRAFQAGIEQIIADAVREGNNV